MFIDTMYALGNIHVLYAEKQNKIAKIIIMYLHVTIPSFLWEICRQISKQKNVTCTNKQSIHLKVPIPKFFHC